MFKFAIAAAAALTSMAAAQQVTTLPEEGTAPWYFEQPVVVNGQSQSIVIASYDGTYSNVTIIVGGMPVDLASAGFVGGETDEVFTFLATQQQHDIYSAALDLCADGDGTQLTLCDFPITPCSVGDTDCVEANKEAAPVAPGSPNPNIPLLPKNIGGMNAYPLDVNTARTNVLNNPPVRCLTGNVVWDNVANPLSEKELYELWKTARKGGIAIYVGNEYVDQSNGGTGEFDCPGDAYIDPDGPNGPAGWQSVPWKKVIRPNGDTYCVIDWGAIKPGRVDDELRKRDIPIRIVPPGQDPEDGTGAVEHWWAPGGADYLEPDQLYGDKYGCDEYWFGKSNCQRGVGLTIYPAPGFRPMVVRPGQLNSPRKEGWKPVIPSLRSGGFNLQWSCCLIESEEELWALACEEYRAILFPTH